MTSLSAIAALPYLYVYEWQRVAQRRRAIKGFVGAPRPAGVSILLHWQFSRRQMAYTT
jgi:hypothetical protein